ncbi:MAG: hypothetical protein QF921_08635 [Pseudomonadales bacterium]|nr:hypothetical protein [Pseudomonadales bacterium]MDP6470217.1 hypothetical protein [Pseudomonadales bacterium]MDP6827123.1 hypothetical protein [Pseudomonadales bacterium]MDP6971561.1 hypothetical protein [Pseudomonadales bacterium]
MAGQTRFVSGLGKCAGIGGDPSPKAALGVLRGIQASVRYRLGLSSRRGLSVAIQGLGNVGFALAKLLYRHGVDLLVADIDDRHVRCAVEQFGANVVSVDEVLFQDVDVVAPCALGGVLSAPSALSIRAPVVAGAANN